MLAKFAVKQSRSASRADAGKVDRVVVAAATSMLKIRRRSRIYLASPPRAFGAGPPRRLRHFTIRNNRTSENEIDRPVCQPRVAGQRALRDRGVESRSGGGQHLSQVASLAREPRCADGIFAGASWAATSAGSARNRLSIFRTSSSTLFPPWVPATPARLFARNTVKIGTSRTRKRCRQKNFAPFVI